MLILRNSSFCSYYISSSSGDGWKSHFCIHGCKLLVVMYFLSYSAFYQSSLSQGTWVFLHGASFVVPSVVATVAYTSPEFVVTQLL